MRIIRLTFLLLCSSCVPMTSSSSISRRPILEAELSSSDPRNVGLSHTKIIQKLERRMRDKPPQSHEEYLHAISLEMREHLCESTDPVCNARIVDKTIHMIPGPKDGFEDGWEYAQSILPDGFDPIVLTHMEDLFFSLSLTGTDRENVRDVLAFLHSNYEKLSLDENVISEDDRQIGLVAYSVGIESTKQWHEIMSDKKSPYHNLLLTVKQEQIRLKKDDVQGDQKGEDRNLQFGTPSVTNQLNNLNLTSTELEQAFFTLLEADVLGGTEGAIMALFDSGVLNPSEERNNTMVASALEEATMASMKAVVGVYIQETFETVTEDCSFPASFWCTSQGGGLGGGSVGGGLGGAGSLAEGLGEFAASGNAPDINGIIDSVTGAGVGGSGTGGGIGTDPGCLFPDSPFCATTTNNNGVNSNSLPPSQTIEPPEVDVPDDVQEDLPDDVPEDPPSTPVTGVVDDDDCLFPDSPALCQNGSNVVPPVPQVDPNAVACMFPGSPLCNPNASGSGGGFGGLGALGGFGAAASTANNP